MSISQHEKTQKFNSHLICMRFAPSHNIGQLVSKTHVNAFSSLVRGLILTKYKSHTILLCARAVTKVFAG
jgi:hypothetical protein